MMGKGKRAPEKGKGKGKSKGKGSTETYKGKGEGKGYQGSYWKCGKVAHKAAEETGWVRRGGSSRRMSRERRDPSRHRMGTWGQLRPPSLTECWRAQPRILTNSLSQRRPSAALRQEVASNLAKVFCILDRPKLDLCCLDYWPSASLQGQT